MPGQTTADKPNAAVYVLRSQQIGVQPSAIDHADKSPKRSIVTRDGLVDSKGASYMESWPTNPSTGLPMQQGTGPGDYAYTPDGKTFHLAVYGPNGEVLLAVPRSPSRSALPASTGGAQVSH